jgi:hypothetical protein
MSVPPKIITNRAKFLIWLGILLVALLVLWGINHFFGPVAEKFWQDAIMTIAIWAIVPFLIKFILFLIVKKIESRKKTP